MSRALALLLVLSCAFGCALVRHAERRVAGAFRGDELTEEELRDHLFGFRSAFSVLVGEAADNISSATRDTQVRRAALLWKIRMPDAISLVIADPNPREAYVESYLLSIAQRQFLEEGGGGAALFGPQQPTAIEAARQIEARAITIGEAFLKPDQLEALRQNLDTIARENPIRGEFLREGVAAGIEKAETKGVFDDVFALPMAPFRALEGVDTGAQAIRQFNVTAQQATDIVADLPQRVRWQMELLTYDLQAQGGALQQALDSFEMLSASSDRMSLAAEKLPDDVRQALGEAGAELEKRSVTLQKLLAEYRAAITDTNATLTTAQPLLEGLTRTAEQVSQASVAWNSIVTQLAAPSPPPPPGSPPAKPFDILEYERTARSITETAEQVRLLLGDVREAEASLISAVARRVVIGGTVLIAVFFGFLLLYRILAARLAPPR